MHSRYIFNVASQFYIVDVMQILWLSDNPLSQGAEYRARVLKMLPHITKLDNVGESTIIIAYQPSTMGVSSSSNKWRQAGEGHSIASCVATAGRAE